MSELHDQLTARKQRILRFAEAATRHQDRGRQAADIAQANAIERFLKKQESVRQRREYETAKTPSAYVPMARRILRAVAEEFDLNIDQLMGPCRSPKFAVPRFVAIGLMLDITKMSLPAIGRALGGRDHSTCCHGRDRIHAMLESESFRNRFDQIKSSILISALEPARVAETAAAPGHTDHPVAAADNFADAS